MNEILIALQKALECQVSPMHLIPPPTPSLKSSNKYRSLKPLHWETSHASVGSLWEVSCKHGNQSRAPKIDITKLESLFCNLKDRALPGSENPQLKGLRLVHSERANRCNILLQDINLPLNDIIKAILALDSSAMSVDQVYDLNKFCPTNEEMKMLKSYTSVKKVLGECEKFFLECARIPRIDSKLQVFAFTITFSRRIKIFKDTLNIIKYATKEIRESTKLAKIMQIILKLGNKLNAGSARGFKIESLDRLGYTWATDKQITLLHFLCEVVAEQTPELLDFYKDLIHLQDAYWIQNKDLYDDKCGIIKGLEKVEQELNASANDGPIFAQSRKVLQKFFSSAGAELPDLTSLFDEVNQYADSLVIYFGEDPNQCSWKQVIISMVCFIEKFKKAHSQNKLLEADARNKELKNFGKEGRQRSCPF
ncbi:hypothetical protein L2E82_48464 [Cichorium intybus]|uniref:Uncharacterized protein n=1 Tax=Cichorium intybus TaxID=13427 RepID=A0ACB8YYG9_CICIN|nr:hypothetical protein L2E82_48464 [Cichorium intybus]